jgi:hypothetical protein
MTYEQGEGTGGTPGPGGGASIFSAVTPRGRAATESRGSATTCSISSTNLLLPPSHKELNF